MPVTRRQFLVTSGASLLATLAPAARGRIAEARGLLVDPLLDEIVGRALAAARKAGASYADIRVVRRRWERVATREDHVIDVGYEERYGLGVRVVAQGAWGFAASSRVEAREAERVAALAVEIGRANSRAVKRPVTLAPVPAHVDVWQTPLIKDPFKVPASDKVDLLLAANAEALKVPGVKFANSNCESLGEWKLFASSDGGYIEQSITRVAPWFTATAVGGKGGEFVTRSHELPHVQGGWEHIEGSTLVADGRRIGEEAVAKLKAAPVVPGKRDLVLAPSNLWLTIHESVGHPTELDRALGYEANMAGTSFATVEKLGKLRYAAPIVTLYADRTTPGGLATCGYDDDGVKTQRWDLVKDGLLVGYQTTREQAAWIGEAASRGCCYAEDHRSFPFQRMPNVSLAPGPRPLAAADLIAATDDGVYITGNGSWSIDHQRHNFQFGGQMFYEIKRGKITGPLKDVAYQSSTVEFWNACDLVGGAGAWQMSGSLHDGKGEPAQSNSVSHGCPPARFRGVNILNTGARGAGGKG